MLGALLNKKATFFNMTKTLLFFLLGRTFWPWMSLKRTSSHSHTRGGWSWYKCAALITRKEPWNAKHEEKQSNRVPPPSHRLLADQVAVWGQIIFKYMYIYYSFQCPNRRINLWEVDNMITVNDSKLKGDSTAFPKLWQNSIIVN